ncbi:RCC1 domain-containing protein [Alcaligenes aquatilis]|uniref:RCC1 domain-containing protein n=1 Tax=Alcaligenes aquatilis TaxID=323284 RepID=UPI003D23DFBC
MTIAHKKTSVLHYTVHHTLIGTCYMRKPLLLLVLAFHAAIPLTSYADYLVVVPTTKAQRAADLALNLSGGALPAAIKGELYSESLNKYLRVTGDPKFKASDVTWSLTSGKLPDGVSLKDGAISGIAAQKGQASFEVLASYKDKTGQQAYTLNVGGRVLQVRSIDAGDSHTCAVTTTGAALCWGANAYSQLGDGTLTERNTPVVVQGLSSSVASITAGLKHTCAVTTTGAALCWGLNSSSQLGDGTLTERTTPVAVQGLSSGVASITAGPNHTCAVTTIGAALCWGLNSSSQLGDGTSTQRTTPVAVQGLSSGVASIKAGLNHTCAVTTTGAALCWGLNSIGQLGDGTSTQRSAPVAVQGLSSGVASITAGRNHTCAMTSAGATLCWGLNSYGQLGDGTTTIRLQPSNEVEY